MTELKRRRMSARVGRRLARALAVAFLACVLLLTLLPGGQAGKVTGIVETLARLLESAGVPFPTGYPVLEFLANVALFMPVAFFTQLGWRRLPWWLICLAAGLLSAGIELIQIGMPTRFSSFSDVIANTLGGVFGTLCVRFLPRYQPSPK